MRCDETKPSCAHCDRLRLRCIYKPPLSLGGSPWPSRSQPSTPVAPPTPSPAPALGGLASAAAAAAAANASQRSPDLNFFNTVLRSDEHRQTIPAAASPLRRLPPDPGSYPHDLGGPFDMLGFMGGITSELEQKHLDLTSGLAASFTASPTPQSLPANISPNRNGDERSFTADRQTPLSPDAPSSLIDSMDSPSDTRGSWSDPGAASYEDQMLQHFLTIDPPAAIFGPVAMEWKYVRPAILANARDFSPLINAVYCYSDIHRAMLEGKPWHWAPTYYRVASSEMQACLLGEVNESTLVKVFAAVFLLMLSEVWCLAFSRRLNSTDIAIAPLLARVVFTGYFIYSFFLPPPTTVSRPNPFMDWTRTSPGIVDIPA